MSEHDHQHEDGSILETPSFEFLRCEVEAGIAQITLDRPQVLNALSGEVLDELAQALDLVRQDSKVRVLVIAGAGKAFVAGADIGEIAKLPDVFAAREYSLLGQEVMDVVAGLPLPTIAVVHGYALGGGLELALACDLRVASPIAKLGLPEVGLGLIPGFGGTQRLPRLIGQSRALDLIYTGRHLSATEAFGMGLVNRVSEDPQKEALDLARTILKNGPVAIALAKETLMRGLPLDLSEGLEIEADLFGLVCSTADMKEGTRAFLERRTPLFKGA